jgi:hypothetical protein
MKREHHPYVISNFPVSSSTFLRVSDNIFLEGSFFSMAWLSVLSVLLVLQGGATFLTPKSIIQSRHVLKMADDVKPVTDKSRATSAFKQFGASAGVFGLIFGKKLLDGPGTISKTLLLRLF